MPLDKLFRLCKYKYMAARRKTSNPFNKDFLIAIVAISVVAYLFYLLVVNSVNEKYNELTQTPVQVQTVVSPTK